MATRNIYIKESDKELWNRAERIAGSSLSCLVTKALRYYINGEKRPGDMIGEDVWIKAKILEWRI